MLTDSTRETTPENPRSRIESVPPTCSLALFGRILQAHEKARLIAEVRGAGWLRLFAIEVELGYCGRFHERYCVPTSPTADYQ